MGRDAPMTEDGAVRPVTQRVPAEDNEDLVSGGARAAIATAGPDGPDCVPVVVRREGGIRVGIDPEMVPPDQRRGRVVLVADGGGYWFELRAAVWRGALVPEDDDGTAPSDDGLVWFRLETRRVVAWDYGRLREDPAG
jgi:hypothetical protein